MTISSMQHYMTRVIGLFLWYLGPFWHMAAIITIHYWSSIHLQNAEGMHISVFHSLCVCVCVHPGALWEGWLINILSREAGRGGIYLGGLFCSWNVPRAFNNSTGSLFLLFTSAWHGANVYHLRVKYLLAFTPPADADRAVTHQWGVLHKAVYLLLYIHRTAFHVLYFWIGSQCVTMRPCGYFLLLG